MDDSWVLQLAFGMRDGLRLYADGAILDGDQIGSVAGRESVGVSGVPEP